MKRWRIHKVILSVLLALTVAIDASAQTDPAAEAQKLAQRATELFQQGDYQGGIPAAERALQLRQRTLGEHADTAASLITLADLCRESGALTRAETLYKQAVAMSETLS